MTTIIESLKYADEIIHGGDPQDTDLAEDWAKNGFTSGEECEPWWNAGCFDAYSAAVLRDAGIAANDVSAMHASLGAGASIGYWHSNGDLSLGKVQELISD